MSQDTDSVEKESDFYDLDSVSDNEEELPDLENDPYVKNYPDYGKNIAYEYYGDFDVTVHDPDNVKELWKEKCYMDLCGGCEKMPFDLCAENYPFEPQIIDGPGKPYNDSYYDNLPQITYKCDALLTPQHWLSTSIFNEKIFHGYNNLFSYYIDSVTGSWQAGGVYLYDIAKKQVVRVSRGSQSYGFNKDKLFFSSFDWSVDFENEDSPYYGQKFLYPLYYDVSKHEYGNMWKMKDSKPISNFVDLRSSDTHVLMTVFWGPSTSGNDASIMYTKIGEWDRWKELTYKKDTLSGLDRRAGYGNMLGQYIVYYDYDLEIQFCDLEKGDEGCFKVSKPGEEARYPFFINKNTVYYVSTDSTDNTKISIIKAEISDKDSIKYSVVLERTNLASAWLNSVDEKYAVFTEKRKDSGVESNALQCFFRFSDKKVFCMDGEFDSGLNKQHAYVYENTYIYTSDEKIAVRDLECYCDYNPENCPLDDYKPNVDNPKDPWKRPFKK
jgi:hypothetical protein